MLKLTFNNNTYEVPNAWEECSQQQFIDILDAVSDLFSGKLSLFQFRVMMALIVTGLKPRRFRKTEQEMLMSENIYRIGEHITFPLRVEYKKASLISKMPDELREKLYRFLPSELDQRNTLVRAAEKMEKSMVPDFVFAANLVQNIKVKRKFIKGYSFMLSHNILTTSLTASQFTEAQTVYTQYMKTGSADMLRLLAAILYFPGKYNGEQVAVFSESLAWITENMLNAILINFQAVQLFITERTKFSLLFQSGKAKKSGANINGLETVIFSLIKSGVSNAEDMNLVKFLELMYSDLVSMVSNLHKQETPIEKIAEQTGLSISKIKQIL